MKKNLHIGIGFALCALFFTSCEKEIIEKQMPAEPQQANQKAIPGEYIVEFVDHGNLGTEVKIKGLADSIAGRPDSNPLIISHYYQCVYKGVAVRLSSTEAESFAQDPRVISIEQDQEIAIPQTDNITESSSTQFVNWGVQRVGWSQSTPTGEGKKVWLIDSGVQHDHPDLTVAPANNNGGSKTFVSSTSNPWDQLGHGTLMAGLIAAKNNTYGVVGVAPGATVVSLRVFGTTSGSISNSLAAVDYVCRHGYPGEVVNLSLGQKQPIPLGASQTALEKGILRLAGAGLLVSMAAGNEDQNYPARNVNVTTPARLNGNGIYTITAMKEDSETTTPLIPDYWMNISYFGDASIVDYCAPGKNVRSTKMNGIYGPASGTSAAAAIFSGILLQKGTSIATDGTVNNDPVAPADPIAHL